MHLRPGNGAELRSQFQMENQRERELFNQNCQNILKLFQWPNADARPAGRKR